MSASSTPTFDDEIINNGIASGKLTIFKIESSDLYKAGLSFDYDGLIRKSTHVAVQPGSNMSIKNYQNRIISTRDKLKIYIPTP